MGVCTMEDERNWFVGVDWASETHHVRVSDARGRKLGARAFAHSGEGLAAMAAWILELTGAAPEAVFVAIEVPHGPVVESLMERGFRVHAINPKQLDRFRDRFSPAGAKDDSRDAEVLGDALRTDPRCFRALQPLDPVVVELREGSRMAEDLKQERNRLGNRVRELLWRFYPQMLGLTDDVAAPWFLDLWRLIPTPEKATRVREATVDRLLKRHRIRRLSAADVLERLRTPAIPLAPGTVSAATAHLEAVAKRLDLVNRQMLAVDERLDRPHPQPCRCARGSRGAEARAVRCDDPPIFARGRTDCPRHAARRGVRGLAAARLSSASMPGGRGSRHQAIRQEPHRAHAPSRPRSLAQRRLPLGARGRAARPEKPSEIRGPSRPRPRSWPRAPIGRRSPHRRGLRHARGQDHLRSEPCQPKSPKPRKTHLLNGGESPPFPKPGRKVWKCAVADRCQVLESEQLSLSTNFHWWPRPTTPS